MKIICIGQRWVSETEPELGLGTLIQKTGRTLTLRFDSSDCIRQYSLASAPLKRVTFKPGDIIKRKDKTSLTISEVTESEGLLFYSDQQSRVCETDLCDTISFSMPQNRLFAGICDTNKLFDLRYRLLSAKARYDASSAKGFLGGQVDLIAHQLFIADTVTSRYIPRVLLSDETGLGKTIEACMILHKLLITHQVQRILIVVPESLVHQWFIELYRKFNLSFMIFNQEYLQGFESNNPDCNPFSEYQLGLISMDTLSNSKKRRQIVQAGWDMVVVDEAHHITDHPDWFQLVQTISKTIPGLMLLSATPEQMGLKNHFSHLNLLDPERYFDFDTFVMETEQYQSVIRTVQQKIMKKEPIDQILDSYGPGRVIFRNKRAVVKGFPLRRTHFIPLTGTGKQTRQINQEFLENDRIKPDAFQQDPRVLFLLKLIRSKEKLLVICRSKEKAVALENAIAAHTSVGIVRFDETMTLLQRDKNAAWFALKTGAQVLICSEIGSEGRNFQFVHHLYLFDLPVNPELLEQRIGRVDRIGQKNDIHIHVPFVLGTVYEILARWFMHGLNVFEKNRDGVHLIFKEFKLPLMALLKRSCQTQSVDRSMLDSLIEKTSAFYRKIDDTLIRNKNILLEMNSFKPEAARKLVREISCVENQTNLETVLTLVLDHYGIEIDEIDTAVFRLKTGQMTDENFPGIAFGSKTMTFKRKIAVVRDDVDFLSWDHPFVQQTFEYFITNGTGSCTTAVLKTGNPGVWFETIFILECVAPLDLNLETYLPPDPVHIVLDHLGKPVDPGKLKDVDRDRLEQDNSNWFSGIEQVKQVLIPSLIEKSGLLAQEYSKPLIRKSTDRIKQVLGREITRLIELKKINPGIKDEEIELARKRQASLLDHLSVARVRLDAIRLIRTE